MPNKVKVGYIGLGRMGGPMAANLVRKGFPLAVYDVRRESAKDVIAAGAVWKDTPAQLADASDIVFMCVPGPAEAEQIVLGPEGLTKNLRPGRILVECTTSSPELVKRFGETYRARGGDVIEACVSGGPGNSAAGTLVMMLGGAAETIAKARPALEAVGDKFHHVGDLGAGSMAKLVHNVIFNCSIQVAVEGLILGMKAGIASDVMLRIISESAYGQGLIHSSVLPRMIDGADLGTQFFPVKLSGKDVGLATKLAKEVGASTPIANLVEQNFIEACARGLGDRDNRAMAKMLAERSGLTNGLAKA